MNTSELPFIKEIQQLKFNHDYQTAFDKLSNYINDRDSPSLDILYEYTELLVMMKNNSLAKQFINELLPLEKSVRMLLLAARLSYYDKDLANCLNYLKPIFSSDLTKISPKLKTRLYSLASLIQWEYLSDASLCRQYAQKASNYYFDDNQLLHCYNAISFVSNYDSSLSATTIAKLHFDIQKKIASLPVYSHKKIKQNSKIRIGYLSADFCWHAVLHFFFALFTKYNKTKFEIYCYSSVNKPDDISNLIKGNCTYWRDISSLSDKQASEIIFNDKPDILFDLSGHTAGARTAILARKPAPIQITGIGYINTTGLKTVDYILSDKYCDEPAGHDQFFSEQRLTMPDTHICYLPAVQFPIIKPLPYLRNGYITFGSFNKFVRTTDEALKLWLTILSKVPNSKLLLKASPFNNEFSTKYIMERLFKIGFKPEQLICRPLTPNWLDEYNDVDIAFDTFPCNGITTICEALYMGVPVMTHTSERRTSRFGYSILKNLGLEECIAHNDFEFIIKTVKLAKNITHLKELHETLHQRMDDSPIMNGKLYMHNLENAYEKIIADWQKAHQ